MVGALLYCFLGALIFAMIIVPGISAQGDFGLKLFYFMALLSLVPGIFVLGRGGGYSLRRFSIARKLKDPIAKAGLFGAIYIALYAVALARGWLSGERSVSQACVGALLMIVVSSIIYFWYSFYFGYRRPADGFFRVFMGGFSFFCVLNLILWVAGMQSNLVEGNTAVDDESTMLGLFGVNLHRVFFPLAQGINSLGVVAGVVFSYGLFRGYKWGRGLFFREFIGVFAFLVSPALCMLLTDSRGAIFMTIASYFLVRWFRVFGGLVLAVSILLPFVFVLFSGLSGSIFSFAARDSSSTGVLSGRELIWAPAIADILSFKPEGLYGYGAYGQVISGVSGSYADYFSGWLSDERMVSVHNAYLQSILDVGLIGLIVFILFYFFALGALRNVSMSGERAKGHANAVLVVLVYLVLQSMSEIAVCATNLLTFLALFSVVTVFMAREGSYNKW